MNSLIRLMCLLLLLTPVSWAQDTQVSPDLTVSSAQPVFTLKSSAFGAVETIPDKYTCHGADINPPMTIENIPRGTKIMALTVHDPDGIAGTWVHWVVFNIPPTLSVIKEKEPPGEQALNDFGNFYFGGPCPPDQKVHHYVFTLYALSDFLDEVNEGSTKENLDKAMEGKILAKAELIGIYQNSNRK